MVVMIFDYGHATLHFTMLVVRAVSLSVQKNVTFKLVFFITAPAQSSVCPAQSSVYPALYFYKPMS